MHLPLHKKTNNQLLRRRQTFDRLAPMYSYYARRSDTPDETGRKILRMDIERQTRHILRNSLRRIGFFIVCLAIIISLASVLTVSTTPRIILVASAQENYLHSQDSYRQAASKLLAASIINRSKLTIDTAAISSALQRQFPELSSVEVTMPLIDHRPTIYLQPAKPAVVEENTLNQLYLVGNDGLVLSKISSVESTGLSLPILKDLSGQHIAPGMRAMPSNSITFVQTVSYQLLHAGVHVSAYTLPAGSSELDAYISDQQYFVKFNLASGTALQQSGTYLAVRHNLAGQGKQPRQYIDVRVDGRAYYL